MCRAESDWLPGVSDDYKEGYKKGCEKGEEWGRLDQYVKCYKLFTGKDLSHREASKILKEGH